MTAQINVQLPAKLAPVFTTPNKDYRGARGGRGGAKTIAFANMAIIEIMKPLEQTGGKPWRFLCGRELQKSLKDSVFSVIASQIIELGAQDAFEVGKEYIRCKNGNEFLFYGLKSNIAEVKGLHGVRRTWLEEAQVVSQSSLTYLIPTVMRDFPDCEIWATWNNEDEDDPIYKLMVTDADERVICVEINYYDNPWFPESLNRVRLKDKKNNPERYEWIWEGKFNTNALGAVYAEWIHNAESAGRILSGGIFDPELPVYTAWDLGYKDFTAIWWFQICHDEVRLIDFYQAQTKDILHYAEQLYGCSIPEDKIKFGLNGKIISFELGSPIEEIKRRMSYKYAMHYLPHDGANKLLQAGGRSTVQQLHELGIKSRIVAATSQQNQIDATRALIKRCWYDKTTCADGIRSMKKYSFKFNEGANKWSDEPDHDAGGYSHGCDAHEIIAQVWKSAIIPKSEEKPRFLHQMTINELFEGNKSTGVERI
jgi:phage terminase large subunit